MRTRFLFLSHPHPLLIVHLHTFQGSQSNPPQVSRKTGCAAKAVECATDAFSPSRSKLEGSASHRTAARHVKCRTELHEELDKPSVVGDDINRPRLNLIEDLLVEVVKCVRHTDRSANLLTIVNRRRPGTRRALLLARLSSKRDTDCRRTAVGPLSDRSGP